MLDRVGLSKKRKEKRILIGKEVEAFNVGF